LSGSSLSDCQDSGIDAVDEQVRVERGLGHERQDLAGLRVEGDQRAATLAVQVLDEFLEPEVDRAGSGCPRASRGGDAGSEPGAPAIRN
jgi:hypothetical protein